MGLRHSEKARLDPRKISDYLLSTIHPVGRHKQGFFVAVEFSYDRPEDLVAAIRRVAREGLLRDETATRYGTKCIVDGWLVAPLDALGFARCGSFPRDPSFGNS